MPPLTRMVALYSGQGMAHLIEFYDNGDPATAPDALVLIDFGGDEGEAVKAVDYIVGKLRQQKQAGRTPAFDFVLISHQDKDHNVLLKTLRDVIKKPTTDPLTYGVKEIYAGGSGWEDGSKANVTYFLEGAIGKVKKTPKFAEPFHCDYPPKSAKAQGTVLFTQSGTGVSLRLLMAQAKRAGTNHKNASSAVAVIENANAALVFPGDATHETMEAINDLFRTWTGAGVKPRPLPPVQAMEVPHHGARDTATQRRKENRQERLKEFAGHMNAKRIFASAGPFNRYGHPFKEIVDVFLPKTKETDPTDGHFYVAGVYSAHPPKEAWGGFYKNESTTRWVYTTVTSIDYRWTWILKTDPKTKKQVKKQVPFAKTWDTKNIEIDLIPSGVKAIRAHRTLTEILADPTAENDYPRSSQPIAYAPAPRSSPAEELI